MMKSIKLFLFLFLVISLNACNDDDEIISCTNPAYSPERMDIQNVTDIVGTIGLKYYKNEDNQTEELWYIQTENLEEFVYLEPDTFLITECNWWLEGVKIKFSGTIEEFCSNLDASIDGVPYNPIIIHSMEKISYCEISYTLDETRNPPLINTQWHFVGFQETDGSISYPTCEYNNIFLRFSDETTEESPDEKICYFFSGNTKTCDFSYTENTEGLLELKEYLCVLGSWYPISCENGRYGQRFDDAMLNSEGIETILEHNLLKIKSSNENATLLFKEVVE